MWLLCVMEEIYGLLIQVNGFQSAQAVFKVSTGSLTRFIMFTIFSSKKQLWLAGAFVFRYSFKTVHQTGYIEEIKASWIHLTAS